MSSPIELILFVVLSLALLAVALLPLLMRGDRSVRIIGVCAFAGTVLIGAFAYLQIGSLQDMRIRADFEALAAEVASGNQPSAAQMQSLLDRIEQRAEATQNPEYWYLLANESRAAQQFDHASQNFERVAEFWPEDSGILAAWAETEFMAQGYMLTPKVRELADRVLQLDPSNTTVLGLLGISAFRIGEYGSAVQFWARALAQMPPMSEEAQMLQSSIERAREMMAATGAPAEEAGSAIAATSPAAAGASWNIDVAIAANVPVPAGASVFVFARVPGSPMPMAVARIPASELPTRVELNDSMVMIPGTSLAGLAQVDLVARLSASGQPIAQPGDYEKVLQIATADIGDGVQILISDPVN